MTADVLRPLRTLLESRRGRLLPLPPRLERLYGNFRAPSRSGPQVFSNFVGTLDGVVSLHARGHAGGGDISGFSIEDRMVMGLLRATADAVIVGSGTFHEDRRHVWTPEAICPSLAREYQRLRSAMAKPEPLLNVVVTASGNIDLRLPVFVSRQVAAMIVTTPAGAARLKKQRAPRPVEICVVGRGNASGDIDPAAILGAVAGAHPRKRLLIEGGPRLLGSFYRKGLIAEQFLTVAPQIAGRDIDDGRLSLVMGKTFGPRHPLWGSLSDVRVGGNLLFLRYEFP